MKKPIYKRVWFWVIVILLVGVIANVEVEYANDGKTAKVDSKENGEKASAESTKEESKFYNVGDTVKIKDVEYTLKSVELTPERNQFTDNQPALVAKISYSVKNDSASDLSVGIRMVEVYGSDNKKAKSYPNGNTVDKIPPGKEKDCITHYGLHQAGDIEIHFSQLFSRKKAIFKAQV